MSEQLIQEGMINDVPRFIAQDRLNFCYLGNLQIKLIDWENLIKTVKHNESVNFVFIGPDKKSNIGGNVKQPQLSVLKSLPNTHFTGAMDKTELVQSMPWFDGFLICYDHAGFPIETSNSHKIMEYLSFGKVVVSNKFNHYQGKELLEMVDNNNDMAEKLKEVTQNISDFNTPEQVEKRKKYAMGNTYCKHIERIESIIRDYENTLHTG